MNLTEAMLMELQNKLNEGNILKDKAGIK